MAQLQVTKRDGTLAPFDIEQIRAAITLASDGVDVNPLELESSFTQSIYDGSETSKIQESLLVAAANLIS